jgi:hypothetical protein
MAGEKELWLHGVQRLDEGPTWNPTDRAWAEADMNDTDARLWHPWLRINRVLRAMLHTRWSAEAWSVVRVEFSRARRRAADRSVLERLLS